MLRHILTVLAAVTLTVQSVGQPIALPPRTVEGWLSNGLHYLILPNAFPRHTIEMRLVMSIGSLQESDEQKGSAHFLEHMATAGTKQFPGNSMVDYFERQGMKYGRDINAFTGFDRTIYWFTLPIDQQTQDIVDTTLYAIRGILSDITFDAARVRAERGVILEELRGYDTNDVFYPLKIGDNRYSRRMPLGDETDISTIDRQRLVDFYDRWYSPCQATLIAVGDIDAPRLEQRLTEVLGTIPAKPVTRPFWPVDYKKGVTLMEVTDSLDRPARLELIVPHRTVVPSTVELTAEKYRTDILPQALSSRIACRKVSCDISNQWYLADRDHLVFAIQGKDRTSLLTAVRCVAEEMKRVAHEGLTQSELDYFIGEKVRRLKLSGSQTFSSEWCDELIDYILAGDRRIHTETELTAVKQLLLQTTPKQMKRLTASLLRDVKQHLLVAYTNSLGTEGALTGTDVQRVWQQASARNGLGQWMVREAPREEQTPVPDVLTASHKAADSAVVARRHYADLGLTQLQLRNGVTLLLRPTMDTDQRLQLAAIGRGGIADIESDDDFYLLKDVAGYMDMGGLQCVSLDTLSSVMGQHSISMNVGIENHWHEVTATADAADAQLLMNLVYEKMHRPRIVTSDFEEVRQNELDMWGRQTLLGRLMSRDPLRQMNNRLDSLVGNVIKGRRPMQKSDLERMTPEMLATYYHQLFTDPKDLTVILTGNFDMAAVERAAIGTFSRMERPDTPLPVFDDPVQPVREHSERFEHDNPSQTIFNYIFAGNYAPSLRTTLTFKLMRDLLQSRLISVLRKQLNFVYSPYSNLFYHGLPQRTYYFWLTIAVKNENSLLVQQTLDTIIGDLQRTAVSEQELQKLKRSFIVTKRQQLSDTAPTEWRSIVTSLLKNGERLDDFDRYAEVLSSITPEDVRHAFECFIDKNHYLLLYQTK